MSGRAVAAPTSKAPAFAAPAVGVLVAALAFLFSWNPSLWGDEAATVDMASRPVGEMLVTAHTFRDSVHAVYYLLMHFWIDAFGQSTIALRLPSALGVGISAALLVVLLSRFVPLGVAVVAGGVYGVLPQTMWQGTEARSFGLVSGVATLIVLLFVLAVDDSAARDEERHRQWLRTGQRVRSRQWPRWLAFGLVSAAALYLYIYIALLLVALGVALVVVPRWRERFVGFTISAGLALVLSVPIVRVARGQQVQVDWLQPITSQTPRAVLVNQFFGTSTLMAIVVWALCLLVAIGGRRLGGERWVELRPIAMLGAAWAFVPTLLLLASTALHNPLYNARYVTFSLPGLAILIVVGLVLIGRRIAVAVVVVLVVLAVPQFAAQRQSLAKGTDWRTVSQRVADLEQPGDAIYFLQGAKLPAQATRHAMSLYPADYRGYVDIALDEPSETNHELYDSEVTVQVALERAKAQGITRMVVPVAKTMYFSTTPTAAALTAAGWHVDKRYADAITDVYVLTHD